MSVYICFIYVILYTYWKTKYKVLHTFDNTVNCTQADNVSPFNKTCFLIFLSIFTDLCFLFRVKASFRIINYSVMPVGKSKTI